MINAQHFVSEIALYMIISLQISCACLSDVKYKHEVGKWIIFLATMTVVWNMTVCLKVSIYQIRLLKQRKRNMARVSAASFVKDFEFNLETE